MLEKQSLETMTNLIMSRYGTCVYIIFKLVAILTTYVSEKFRYFLMNVRGTGNIFTVAYIAKFQLNMKNTH